MKTYHTRYVVVNPYQTAYLNEDGYRTEQTYTVAYNTALGKDEFGVCNALKYARIAAGRAGGIVYGQEYDGGVFTTVRDYTRKEKSPKAA